MEQLKQILFIDIETAPATASYDELSEGMKTQWKRKALFLKSKTEGNTDPALLYGEKAAIFAEFARVVCICIGGLTEKNEQWKLVLKPLFGRDEKVLLNDFCTALAKFTKQHPQMNFCGHNIREFDIPFLCRRMMINDIPLPECMQLHGKKPWDIHHLDTLELWRFGDYKNFTSLALLAEVLGIPSPKEDIDGSMVGEVYWVEQNLDRIAQYCLRDVLTTAKIFLRLKGLKHIAPEPEYIE